MFVESPAAGSSAEVFGGSVTENREETRSEIILLHAEGRLKRQIAEEMETDIKTVHKWCGRWEESRPGLMSAEETEAKEDISPAEYEKRGRAFTFNLQE